ncbi:MAG: glycoside hydrolase, partial [Candidatus Dormibacteraeota bacterium]|nr:glycoside hydrolase [Candidatus Dormibacteraeota bacterium]
GRHWTRSPVPGATDCTGGPAGAAVDPSLAFGPGGRVAASESWITSSTQVGINHDDIRMFVGRSDDGGRTFAPAVEPEPTQPDQRGFISFDPARPGHLDVETERSPFIGGPLGTYIYGAPGSIVIVGSDDGGRSYGAPVQVFSTLPGTTALAAGLLRSGPDLVAIIGTVSDSQLPILLLGHPVPQRIIAVRSGDGGRSFGAAVDVGTFYFGNNLTNCCLPQAAVAPDGTMYVTWPDGPGGSVVLARSLDHGQNWATRSALTTAHGATMPSVAVAGDGTVGLFYYDVVPHGSHASDANLTPYVATSRDGATGWTTVPLGRAFDLAAIKGGNADQFSVGPYQGMIGLPLGFGVSVTLGAPYAPASQERVWYVEVSSGADAGPIVQGATVMGLPDTGAGGPWAGLAWTFMGALAVVLARRRARRWAPGAKAAP